MFQAFDNPGAARAPERAQWLALLARAPLALLESALQAQAARRAHWLRKPETGLMMVQGRIGGDGTRFHLGEITVTRCALRLEAAGAAAPDALERATVGLAWVLGRSHRQVRLAALADALLQDPQQQRALDTGLLEPIRQQLRRTRAERQALAASTRVDFFTVARESAATGPAGAADAANPASPAERAQ